jgi:oligopeptide/dipeptide ABC transporter ATP-binding protein
MRQRVIIAMALALEPELVIMDEPTTALDVVVQREILQEVQQLQRELGFAVLFITHDLSLLLEFADRVAIMYAGEIVELAESQELFANSLHPYSVGLLNSFPPLSGPIDRLAGIPGSPPDLSDPPTGCRFHPGARTANPAMPPVHAADHRAAGAQAGRAGSLRRLSSRRGVALVSTPELDVRALTKDFGKLRAVDDVSFTLRQGTITALVGESGSGKSTVARILARLHNATSGSVIYDGTDVLGRRDVKLYRSRVQMIFQDPFDSLNPVRTIKHHLERPVRIHSVVSKRDVTPRVHELLRTVGLVPPEKYAAKYPHELSGGQRQRVAIARALAVNPSVILADEPISMLDVSIRIGILNLMLGLKQELGIAFLYITHDIASARYVADEVLVMYAGQIVEQGPTDSVLLEPLHSYTRLPALRRPAPGARPLAPAARRPRRPQRRRHRRGNGARRRTTRPLRQEACSMTEKTSFPADFSWAQRRRRTRSRAPPTRTAGARASGTGSARRRARCETARAARSPATSTTGIPTTSG